MRSILLFCCLLLGGAATAQSTYYTVQFPNDKTYIGCGVSNVPVEMPVITQYACHLNVGVSRTDQIFNSNSTGTCYKIFRRWRLTYKCHPNPNVPFTIIENPANSDVGATATGNATNFGALEYVQIIKVRDDVPPNFVNCPADPVIFCDYTGNDPSQYGSACEGPVAFSASITDDCSVASDLTLAYRFYLDLDGNGSMESYVSSSSPGAWPITTSISGNVVTGTIQFPTGFGLPYGNHKIEWIAGDRCGNERLCKYDFVVKDCKAPTVVCLNGISVNIMPTGMIGLQLTTFLQYAVDNCTPTNLIKYGIRKAGTGTGFPANTTEVVFDCSELGTQPVEIWAQDASGNADYCLTYVIVQDNQNSCAPSGPISGKVLTLTNAALPPVQMKLKNSSGVIKAIAQTDAATGEFVLSGVSAACGYTLHAALDSLHTLGLSTLDALLVAAHAEGVLLLDAADPLRWVVADVDRDGQIEASDAQAIVEVASGAQSELTNGPAWVFLGQNAAATSLLCLPAYVPFSSADFLALKNGDVNFDGQWSGLQAEADDRTTRNRAVAFRAQEAYFNAGDVVYVPVRVPHLDRLAGFQFTLQLDPALATLVGVQAGLVPATQIGVFTSANQVSTGWQSPLAFYPEGGALFGGQDAFVLIFNALQAGKVSDVLSMNSQRVRAETYRTDLQVRATRLDFDPVELPRATAQMFPPQPNPVPEGGAVTLRYWLPEAADVRIRMCDATGVSVQEWALEGQKGHNTTDVQLAAGRRGLLFVQLVTADQGVATQRVRVE
jgi:hypothetical protein